MDGARKMLEESGLPIKMALNFEEAAEKAVASLKQ